MSICMNMINRILFHTYKFRFNFTILFCQQFFCLITFVILSNTSETFRNKAGEISYNDYKIRFNWLLSENATMYAGNITACVQIEGTDEKGNLYKNKTKNFIIVIQDALSEYDADGVYTSWATEIEDKIEALEEAEEKTTDVFAGTQEEYNQAVINNKFSNGMVITITDE